MNSHGSITKSMAAWPIMIGIKLRLLTRYTIEQNTPKTAVPIMAPPIICKVNIPEVKPQAEWTRPYRIAEALERLDSALEIAPRGMGPNSH